MRRHIEQAISAEHHLDVVQTTHQGHGRLLVQQCLRDGVEAVMVWGGDGMVNEAVNGLAGSDVGLAVIPSGSTSAFARTLGIPTHAVKATSKLLESLRLDRRRRIGLGKMNESYFSFTAGVGFDGAIVREVEARSKLKRTVGASIYVAAAISVFQRGFDRRRARIRLRYDDGETSPPLFFATVGNSSPYSYLGNLPIEFSPSADFDRPLQIMGVTRFGFMHSLRVMLAALTRGKFLRTSPHVHTKSAESVSMESSAAVDVQTDGEYRGKHTEVQFGWEPSCLDVYY